ncbi:MAG TPA: phosphoglycolate phosphatase [Candidatus Competibacteraceae bacterium]|nr:phosphoglycolate phosphatase [Candidatus Competibacteraceae bacterium]
MASALRCVLFDLDGTLLDTAPDMARALNGLRQERGLAPLPFARIRPVVSHGSLGLVRLGFDRGPGDPGFDELRARFLDIYAADLARDTVLFPGMVEVLQRIERQGLAWGIVTNKPGWLTEPLLAALDLRQRAACVVSGDTVAERKPHPAPLLHACRVAGVQAQDCLYLGDAERDIEAGRRAGMTTVVARYGYLAADEHPEQWGAHGLIDHPRELLDWLPT